MILGGSERRRDEIELFGDPLLLTLEEIKRDRIGVVGFKELRALGQKLASFPKQPVVFLTGVVVVRREVIEKSALKDVAQAIRDLNGGVMLFNEFLDPLHRNGPHGAAGSLLMLPDAGEVGVASTSSA